MNQALDQLFNSALPQSLLAALKTDKPKTFPDHVSGDMLQELPIELLVDFPIEKHPFRPYTREKLDALRHDIIERGVIQPLIVRSLGDHQYQIIAGHNRRTAARERATRRCPVLSGSSTTMKRSYR